MKEIKRRIVFFSSIDEDWGGSEELWAKGIPFLQKKGYSIFILKKHINRTHPKFIELSNSGVILEELEIEAAPKPKRLRLQIYDAIILKFRELFHIYPKEVVHEPNQIVNDTDLEPSLFIMKIKNIDPDIVIVAQGINFDGLEHSHQLYAFNIPYAVIAQKAVEFYWPYVYARPYMRIASKNALKNFFVSFHNLKLTEEQLGMKINNALVVQNPIKTKGMSIPYPTKTDRYQLACIGRLFVLDKGQDILIKILANPKWKSRPISVSFIGTGMDESALKELASYLEVENVDFIGHINGIEEMWNHYHALILPSRAEGMPLVMLEAMAVGRTVIVSDAGGNSELITDGENGFIGYPNLEEFEKAMERAWKARDRWDVIGKNAQLFIEQKYHQLAEEVFSEEIIKLIDTNRKK